MSAEPYATAAGLVERSAAAFASGVPEHPADDGFFGPASVTWRLSGDLGGPIAGLRSLPHEPVEAARIVVALVSGPVKSPRPVIAASMQLHPTVRTGVNAQAVAAAVARSIAACPELAVESQIESAVPGPPSRRSSTGSGK